MEEVYKPGDKFYRVKLDTGWVSLQVIGCVITRDYGTRKTVHYEDKGSYHSGVLTESNNRHKVFRDRKSAVAFAKPFAEAAQREEVSRIERQIAELERQKAELQKASR